MVHEREVEEGKRPREIHPFRTFPVQKESDPTYEPGYKPSTPYLSKFPDRETEARIRMMYGSD